MREVQGKEIGLGLAIPQRLHLDLVHGVESGLHGVEGLVFQAFLGLYAGAVSLQSFALEAVDDAFAAVLLQTAVQEVLGEAFLDEVELVGEVDAEEVVLAVEVKGEVLALLAPDAEELLRLRWTGELLAVLGDEAEGRGALPVPEPEAGGAERALPGEVLGLAVGELGGFEALEGGGVEFVAGVALEALLGLVEAFAVFVLEGLGGLGVFVETRVALFVQDVVQEAFQALFLVIELFAVFVDLSLPLGSFLGLTLDEFEESLRCLVCGVREEGSLIDPCLPQPPRLHTSFLPTLTP